MKAAAILVCAITVVSGKVIQLYVGNGNDDNGNPGNYNPAEASKICSQNGSNGVLVAHEYCNRFYNCFNGQPFAQNCITNLLYNPAKEQCDWPENVYCGNRIIPKPEDDSNGDSGGDGGGHEDNDNGDSDDNGGPGNDNPAEAPEICSRQGSESTLVAHEYCNRFYKCNNGKPVPVNCPANLLYNPPKEQCDWPENVYCANRIIPKPEDDSNGDSGGGGGGHEDNDNGDSDDNGGPGNDNPAEAPEICSRQGSESTLVAHEYCNRFYKCNNGKPVPVNCPANLLYNPPKEQCDWPENVHCANRTIPKPEDDSNGGSGGEGGGHEDNDNGDSDDNGGPGNDNPAEAPEICSRQGSESTLVAHEYCNRFYKCNNGKPVPVNCPANLLYNPAKEQCDWPENVYCGNRIIPKPEDDSNGDSGGDGGGHEDNDNGDSDNSGGPGNDNPAEASEICSRQGSESTLVAHEYCNRFYKCNNGKPVPVNCPANLLYNPPKEQCDWPENVHCANRTIPKPEDDSNGGSGGEGGGHEDNDNGDSDDNGGPGNDNPAEAPEICSRQGSESTLVAHEYCNRFYKCNNGKPVPVNCPANLLYNPAKEQCDWPENVHCANRTIPKPEDDSNGGSGGEGGGHEDNDNGDSVDNGGPGNDNPAEAPEICSRQGSESTLVAHEYCNRFYKCNNGKPVPVNCPANLLYNPAKEQCDWPENVHCANRTIPKPEDDSNGGSGGEGGGHEDNDNGDSDDNGGPGNDNPAEAPEICSRQGSESTLVAHEYCNRFYKCNNGKPVPVNCPANLLYNPAKEQCDWPENVHCANRTIPKPEDDSNGGSGGEGGGHEDNDNGDSVDNGGPGNDNPAEAPEICSRQGSESTLVAHEYCNRFYKCNNGKPVPVNCPANLLYNPAKEQCDWPENVHCANRTIPKPEDDSNGDSGGDGGGHEDNDNGDSDNSGGPGNDNPAEAPEICSRQGSESTLVAHEYCNRFYKCNNGKPVPVNCPANLLYNPAKEQCDWPENVYCANRTIPKPEDDSNGGSGGEGGGHEDNDNGDSDDNGGPGNDNPAEAPEICSRQGSESTLVAHEYCNRFYKCNNGKPVPVNCPANLLYNPAKEQCDWLENVHCANRTIPKPEDDSNGGSGGEGGGHEDNDNGDSDDNGGPGNDNPAEAPEICSRQGSESTLVAHEYCNRFYKCNNGKPVPVNCPANLLYNPAKEQCDWPENVHCANRTIPKPEDDSNGGSGGEGGGHEDNDNGDSDDNGGPGNDNPAEAPEICSRQGSESTLVAHEYCNRFYKCNNGKPVPVNCPANLLYNPPKEQCDWPENVHCANRTIPKPEDDSNGDSGGDGDGHEDNDNGDSDDNGGPGNDNPAEAPEICSRQGSESTLVAHEYCNRFYKCNNGKPVPVNCPANLLYNPSKEQCDWPENVHCANRTVPKPEDDSNGDSGGDGNGHEDNDNGDSDDNGGPGNDNPAEAPEICAREGSNGLLVAHELCNQFYICSNGAPVALKCQSILLFNSRKGICDWSSNVDCGNRLK